jgi:hypothetical protein
MVLEYHTVDPVSQGVKRREATSSVMGCMYSYIHTSAGQTEGRFDFVYRSTVPAGTCSLLA